MVAHSKHNGFSCGMFRLKGACKAVWDRHLFREADPREVEDRYPEGFVE